MVGAALLDGIGMLVSEGLDEPGPGVEAAVAFAHGLELAVEGDGPVTLTRARIVVLEGQEICRVDVAASTSMVRAKTSKADYVVDVRINLHSPDAQRRGRGLLRRPRTLRESS